MARRALLGHAQVGGLAARVEECDALRPDLGQQSGGLRDAPEQERPLAREVAPLLRAQLLQVDHRVVEQATGQGLSQRAVAQLGAVGHQVLDQRVEPGFEVG